MADTIQTGASCLLLLNSLGPTAAEVTPPSNELAAVILFTMACLIAQQSSATQAASFPNSIAVLMDCDRQPLREPCHILPSHCCQALLLLCAHANVQHRSTHRVSYTSQRLSPYHC